MSINILTLLRADNTSIVSVEANILRHYIMLKCMHAVTSRSLLKVPGSSPGTVVMLKLFISFNPVTDVNKVCAVVLSDTAWRGDLPFNCIPVDSLNPVASLNFLGDTKYVVCNSCTHVLYLYVCRTQTYTLYNALIT